MKKRYLIGISAVCLIAAIAFTAVKHTRIIGTIRGAEWETIIINDVVYQHNSSLAFRAADKGKFLGIVTNGNTKFRVYSVKGDTDNQYIYRLWGYDGAFYSATDQEGGA